GSDERPNALEDQRHEAKSTIALRRPHSITSSARRHLVAPPYSTSVALLRKATSCFRCSNVNELFVLTSAAAGDEDLRLEVAAACAFDIVAYMVAVFFGASRATVNLRLSTRSRATFTVSGVAASAISMIS